MSWLDWLGGSTTGGTGAGNLSEYARLRSLGQSSPEGVEMVGPNDPITPQEEGIYFPKGVPDEQHRGGLGDLAAFSRQQLANQQQQGQEVSEEGAAAKPQAETPGAASNVMDGGAGNADVEFFSDAPDARAAAEKKLRQQEAWNHLAYSVGKAAAKAASMGGGGMGGGGGGGMMGGGGGGMGGI